MLEGAAAAAARTPQDRVIIALDCSEAEALALADALSGKARFLKVGMTLYYAAGPQIVKTLRERGFKVFIDLKLHDIPHQVRGAAASLSAVGAEMTTVHAQGGVAMMQGAMEGVRSVAPDAAAADGRPAVLGITVLTSMGPEDLEQIGIGRAVDEQVEAMARLVAQAGLDGVVCSPLEAKKMREVLGPEAFIVTPGVRPAGSAIGDQNRVATPAAAIEAGASHIVVGRPITQADDPVAAFEAICAELSEVC